LEFIYYFLLFVADKPRDALHHGKHAANKGGRSVW